MSRQLTMYNSFTGMNPSEISATVHFVSRNAGNALPREVQESIDYALKHKPSFGGFVVTTRENQRIIGAMVVNRTGMEGNSPNHICVYLAVDPSCTQPEEVLCQLLQKAISITLGDIAMHVEPDHPALQLYERLGFRRKYLELRLDQQSATA